ncbi:hypothetical protein B0G76_2539 [Paraburkholderia sp. BL23I1N1]|nr:hypothetical protein B0G76_2539 [Paraburkholderia sp. BL23I1N1]
MRHPVIRKQFYSYAARNGLYRHQFRCVAADLQVVALVGPLIHGLRIWLQRIEYQQNVHSEWSADPIDSGNLSE